MKSLNTAKQYFALCLLTCSAAFADQAPKFSEDSAPMSMQSMPSCEECVDASAVRAPRIPGPGNPPVTPVSDVVYGDFYITKNLFVKGSIEAGCNVKIGGCVDLSNCCNVNVCHPENTDEILNVGGTVQAAAFQTFSDVNMKQNIQMMDSKECLNAVMALQPKSFSYIDGLTKVYGLPQGRHVGFVAQDVEMVMPEAVVTSSLELDGGISKPKSINMNAMIPMLVGAVQECAKEIKMLRNEIAQLKKQR